MDDDSSRKNKTQVYKFMKIRECAGIVLLFRNTLHSRAFHRHLLVGIITYFSTVLALHVMLSILEWETLMALIIYNIFLYIVGFALFRKYVYKRDESNDYAHSPKSQAIRFAVSLLAFRISDASLSFFLIDGLKLSYFIVPLIVASGLFVAKFFVYRNFVFNLVRK